MLFKKKYKSTSIMNRFRFSKLKYPILKKGTSLMSQCRYNKDA